LGHGFRWLLAFPLGYGAVGLWLGLALGLAAVAVLLTLRLNWIAQPPADAVAAVALH
jgi:MATE family multidrug resistance protein